MKKILSAVMAVIMVLSVTAGMGIFYASPVLDYTPNRPIEFHDMNKFLFREKEFDTKLSSQHPTDTDDWRNFYWCDFKPQYAADYSFDVRSKFRMKCEIYDADNNLLSVGNSDTTKGSDKLYHFSLTYHMEKGKQYYFKFAFTEGNIDTVGKFWVYFSSTESGTLNDADHLHLYVNDSSTAYTYELAEYSISKLMEDLTFIVVYPNGRFSKWISRDTPMTALDGVDIMFDASDCGKTVGQHTIVAHYLGYGVKATFNIVNCKHNYQIDSIEEPEWKETGAVNYMCAKCGDTYSEIIPAAEELKPIIENSINAKYGDDNFNVDADINRDNVINARDIAIVLKAYEAYETPTCMKGEGISQSFEE